MSTAATTNEPEVQTRQGPITPRPGRPIAQDTGTAMHDPNASREKLQREVEDLKEQVNQLQQQLAATNLQHLAAQMRQLHHDLNQPLYVISGYCDLLLLDADNEGKCGQYASTIQEQVGKMTELLTESRRVIKDALGKAR